VIFLEILNDPGVGKLGGCLPHEHQKGKRETVGENWILGLTSSETGSFFADLCKNSSSPPCFFPALNYDERTWKNWIRNV